MDVMLRRLLIVAVALLALAAGVGYALVIWPMHDPHPAEAIGHGTFAIENARLYVSPDDPPIERGSILVRDGRIVAVGQNIAIPAEAEVLPCDHCVVSAGFWNNHVHFTEPHWINAAFASSAKLNPLLSEMLTSRGFTTVVDVGSDPRVTLSLRRRIEEGDLLGPKIYSALAAQYPPQGIPFYLRNTLPPFLQKQMPQPATPGEAAKDEEANVARGADVLKLFTGSYVEKNYIKPMPVENARAAVQVAHAHGQLAFAHPSNLTGVLIARDAGVDILAHAADETEGVTPEILKSLIDHHMSMVPTLKMFGTTVTHNPAYLQPIYDEVRAFRSLGGELLFGTDVGYMTDYSTQDEFDALAHSGLTWRDMLRMLTTAPAARFHVEKEKGTVTAGKLADLVILGSDPAENPLNFADVRLTMRGGRILYQRK
jgi:imidazolonepropionase-like amidohydrolase